MRFWDNFVEACAEKGVAPTTAMKQMGISTGNIARWQSGGSPSMDMLVAISTYFRRSIDFLVTGIDFKPDDERLAATTAEVSMLQKFRQLPPDLQGTAIVYIEGVIDCYKKMQETMQETVQENMQTG